MSINTAEICEKFQSKDRKEKICALELLQQKCFDIGEACDSEVLQIFDQCYLNLLKLYSDRFESVREKAIETVGVFIFRLPPNDFHLVNIVSTIVERMGQEETIEDSEEVRLLLMQQILTLEEKYISTHNKFCMQECYESIVQVILKALKDCYPAVQKEACDCIVQIAAALDTYSFSTFAERLAKGLYRMLNHKHSQCRIAGVKTLGFVALHIDASGDALSRLIMEVSPLLMDSMPLVRRECGELGVRLLLGLRDRYSYFERLLPLVLCCLKDDSEEVREYILPLWEKCGKQYYDENEAELSKQEIADLKSPNYPSNCNRPTIGCRGIVQRSLRVLNLIMRESNDWKENVRIHSFKLLFQFILHAETAMTAKFFEIYPYVARALTDVQSIVVEEAVKVSDLMGRLFNYDDWREHGFEGFEKNNKEGHLKCFYYMYTSSFGVKIEHNLRLSKLLTNAEFSQTMNANIQLYVLKMNETILDKCDTEMDPKDFEEICKNCYCSTMKVMSLCLESENSRELQTKATKILLKVSELCNCNTDDLHDRFFIYNLEYVQNINAALDAFSEPILLLYGLVKFAKFRPPYLKELQLKINDVFEHCADESKIKIFNAVSVAMLDWSKTVRKPVAESCDLLKEFLISIVEPHLIWKAGAYAEALRSLATATLCAVSQGAAEESCKVLPNFAKYMPSLLEDNFLTTRFYAIKCLYNFGEIDIIFFNAIAYGCLQRLNDPSPGIRIFAASVIPKLQLKLHNDIKNEDDGKNCNRESEILLTFMKNCFDMLYLHYDTPEERLQDAIRETLIELSKQYPEISKDSYERNICKSSNLRELKKHLPKI